MAVQFARQLRDIVDAASRDGRTELRFALHMIADILVETFDSDLRSVVIDRRSATDAMAIARAAAEVVDACHLIEASLFGARSERCFEDISLPIGRSYDTLADFVERRLRGPAIYMIWQREPQRLIYAGHVGGAQAQTEEARGALFGALQQGSVVTLMTPSPATTVAAGDLETALLVVLDRKNAFPALNVRSDGVRGALGTAFLATIGQLLGELASNLRAPAGSYRKLIG